MRPCIMNSKRPSGADYRKRRQNTSEENRKIAISMSKWILKNTSNDESQRSHENTLTASVSDVISSSPACNNNNEIPTTSEIIAAISQQLNREVTPPILRTGSVETLDISDTVTETIQTFETNLHSCDHSDLQNRTYPSAGQISEINFNDPPSWPSINDKIRCHLVEHGPDQGEFADFRESTSENGRKFSGN